MKRLSYTLVLFSLFSLISCATSNQRTVYRDLSSHEANSVDEEHELVIVEVLKHVLNGYSQYEYEIESVDSEDSIEFIIRYHPADHPNFFGVNGIRIKNIRELVNELSIALQTKENIGNKDFHLKNRKYYFIRFSRTEEEVEQ